MSHQVDGSGQHAEAISPPTSPPTRYTSPMSEMIENSPPIPVESHHQSYVHPDASSPIPVEHHVFPSTSEKKFAQASPYAQDYSALEVVEQYPPQYQHQYGGPPPGSPPPGVMSPMPMKFDEKGQPIATANGEPAVPHSTDEPKIFGMRKRTFYMMLFGVIALVVLAIALGAGLGVGLKKKKGGNSEPTSDPFCTANPDLCIGGALNSEYFSNTGAFNGSGIALAGESWNKNQRRIFTIYFQHHTGDIRYMQYTTDRAWIGGSKSETVASDAKNGTSISAVAYALNSTQYVNIFYINKDNKVRQTVLSNDTDIWAPGPLNDLNLDVYDSPSVGLQACWKGNFYGDADYSKFPTSDGQGNKVKFDQRIGINLWYPSDDSTFEQYVWYNGQDTWLKLTSFQGMNVHAGVGCYSWGAGTVQYAMMVNKKNDTEIWWKDTNATAASSGTESHPYQSWVNSTEGAIDDVYPAASAGYTTFFYTQMADKTIKGFNISFDAEKTDPQADDAFVLRDLGGPVPGLGGTHLTCTAYTEYKPGTNLSSPEPDDKLWDSLYVFYQTEGDDITALSRPIAGGEWTKGKLNITAD